MPKSNPKRVIVVGAGLAGLSCAIELIERGHTPTVLEGRSYIGGRTASFTKGKLPIESGLHRYLGFYKHLPKLLRKANLKLRDVVFWEDAIEMRYPEGPQAVYHASVHRPLRTLRSFIGNGHYLTWRDRGQLVRLFSWGLFDYFVRPTMLKNISVAQYCRRHGVGEQSYNRAVRALCEGIFFTPPSEYAAYNLFGLVGPYLLGMWRFRIGGFRGGMTEVMCQPIARTIERRGGKIETDAEVRKLVVEDQRVVGVELADGQQLRGDAVVLACSLDATQRLLKSHFPTHRWHQPMQQLKMVPVVTLHLELSQPALPFDRTTFGPTTPLAAFAEQSRTTFDGSDGRLSVILAPPTQYLDMDVNKLTQQVVAEFTRIGIDITQTLKQSRKVVLPRDFYSLDVGMDQLRPSQHTPVDGLVLAGDYTRQKYLATMEGAVYSGKLAAKQI